MPPHCLTGLPLSPWRHCAIATGCLFRVIFPRDKSHEISDRHCIQILMARKVETPRSAPRKSPTFVSVTGDHFFRFIPFYFDHPPPLSLSLSLSNIRIHFAAKLMATVALDPEDQHCQYLQRRYVNVVYL